MINLPTSPRRSAFTLVEVLVSTVILGLIVIILVSITNQTTATWRYTTGKIEQFSSARDAFESLTRQVGQSTLNTYYDYLDDKGEARTVDNAGLFVPKNYGRQSSLRFMCGSMDRSNRFNGDTAPPLATDGSRPRPTHGIFFHAPLGLVDDVAQHGSLQNLLNAWGYYVEFDSDERTRPTFLQGKGPPPRWRYRLMQFMQPSEKMITYTEPDQWFQTAVNEAGTPNAHILAENVVALVLQPMLSPKDEQELATPPAVAGTALAPSYFYDSTKKHSTPALNPRHQLPPMIRVTMVAIDEPSAIRLSSGSAMPDFDLPSLFQTDRANSASDYERDLGSLETKLTEKRCSFRVFTTTVVIRGAKWSKE
jgi:uncharacterized protein (TIGR02599 family)